MSVSPKGFVTRELHLEILKDLDNYLVEKQIARPVWLFMDGASPHISLSALEFCKLKKIQPWLFKPNSTHLLQVLLFYKTYGAEFNPFLKSASGPYLVFFPEVRAEKVGMDLAV